MALELEDVQHRLQRHAKKTPNSATARQEGLLIEQRNALQTRMKAWERLSPIYMPGLLQYQTNREAASSENPVQSSGHPEDTDIWLPSRIPCSQRVTVCLNGLPEMEDRLRTAQCRDSLEAIRNILKIKAQMIAFKNKNVRGQRQGTRSRAIIDRVHDKAKAAAEKYRAARQAKMELVGPGDWEVELCVLDNGDIRGYQDPNRLQACQPCRGVFEDDELHPDAMDVDRGEPELSLFNENRTQRDGTGETRQTLSWIWLGPQAGGTDNAGDDILRSEWAKSRARAARATEEVCLLKEEMRRILAFLEWRSKWWRTRASRRSTTDPALAEGLSSYALSQSVVQDTLGARCRELWGRKLDDEEVQKMVDAAAAAATLSSRSQPDVDIDDDDEDGDDHDEDEDKAC